MYRVLVATHVFANMVWIGSIVAAGAMLAAKQLSPLPDRAKHALWTYRRLAVPAFLVSLLVGCACLILDPSKSLLKMPSMHAKLTLAVGVIALHHWIGAAARRIVYGRRSTPIPILTVVLLLVFAGGAAVLGVAKPF